MAPKTLAQLVNSLTSNNSSDLIQISRSGADYKETFANIAKEIMKELTTNYFVTLTPKNISASNQVTNLSVYEAGGAQEKENGFEIDISWTGGNKTYSHAWTGTGYNINGISIGNWIGYGAGRLRLMLDKTNSNWIVVSFGVWDTVTTTNGGVSRRYVDRTVEINHIVSTPANNYATFTYDFTLVAPVYVEGSVSGGISDYYFVHGSPTTSSVTVAQRYGGGYNPATGSVVVSVKSTLATV
jgi:hypothetical protein